MVCGRSVKDSTTKMPSFCKTHSANLSNTPYQIELCLQQSPGDTPTTLESCLPLPIEQCRAIRGLLAEVVINDQRVVMLSSCDLHMAV